MLKKNVHIAILVCTAQRPKMLVKCLKSLSKQTIAGQCELTIIVIENDAIQPTKPIVDSLNVGVFEPKNIDLIYDFEAKRGIPFARNKALEVCCKVAPDYVLMIDDDEIAPANWIECHLQFMEEFQADIIRGQVYPVYDVSTPFAVKMAPKMKNHGKLLKTCATGNVFFKFFIIDPKGLNLKFDNRFSQGHEDTEFFERAYKFGMRIINNEKSIVTETVPESRTKYSRFFMRNLQYGAVISYELILKRGWFTAFRKQVFRFSHVRRLIASTVAIFLALILWPFSKKKSHRCMIYALKRYAKVFGSFYGLTGRQIRHWDKIDGY